MSLFAGSIASRMFEPARWVAGEVRRLPVQPRSHAGIRGLGGGGVETPQAKVVKLADIRK